jgi:hypothetical protein
MIRLSEDGQFLLSTCRAATGYNNSRIIELCLAMQSLRLGREVRRAHEFLYDNIVQALDDQRMLEARRLGDGKRAKETRKLITK